MKTGLFVVLASHFLLELAHTLCSIKCLPASCTFTDYGNCSSCQPLFIHNSMASPQCQLSPSSGFQQAASTATHLQITSTIPPTGDAQCSTYDPSLTIFGYFNPQNLSEVKIVLPASANSIPHFSMRILVGIMAVGEWESTDQFLLVLDNDPTSNNTTAFPGMSVLSGLCNSSLGLEFFGTALLSTSPHSGVGAQLSWTLKTANILNATLERYYAISEAMVLVEACAPSCLQCSGSAANCQACTPSGPHESFLVASSSSCVAISACPSSTHPSVSTHVCEPCTVGSCLVCSLDVDVCEQCTASNYLLLNTCISACPSQNYYPHTSTAVWRCQSCPPQCLQCTSPIACTKCTETGLHESYLSALTPNQCVAASACEIGSYPDPATHVCEPCNSSCLTCSTSADVCTECAGALALLQATGVCYTTCPASFFQTTDSSGKVVCQACYNRCKLCHTSSTNCSSCQDSGPHESFLKIDGQTCVDAANCDSGTYGQSSTHICKPCSSTCLTCVSAPGTCTQCHPGFYLLNENCVQPCPPQYFETLSAGIDVCGSCSVLCHQCNGPLASQCSQCTIGGVSQAFLLNTTCYQDCPAAFFEEGATQTCDSCKEGCTECTGNPMPCQSCSGLTHSFFGPNQTCETTCPSKYYSSSSPPLVYNVCKPCSDLCQECFGPTFEDCTLCDQDDSAFLSGNTCVQYACLAGYGFTQNLSAICVRCHVLCNGCENLRFNCTACFGRGGRKGYMLVTDPAHGTGRCYRNCPNPYYQLVYYNTTSMQNQLLCDSCNTTACLTCDIDPNNCTSCPSSAYLHQNNCLSQCPQAYFQNSITNLCQSCLYRCLLCEGWAGNCSLCNPARPAYYLANRCHIECPPSYYESNFSHVDHEALGLSQELTCLRCDSSCNTCDGTPISCLSCSTNYYFFHTHCFQECPEQGYFQDLTTQECLLCSEHCVTLQITLKFESIANQAIVATMKFTEPLDFFTFPYQEFQYFKFSDPFFTTDMFNFEYTILNDHTYQIRVTVKRFIFMYNLKVYVITHPISQHDYDLNNYYSLNVRPFYHSVYDQGKWLRWTLIHGPDLQDQPTMAHLQTIISLGDSINQFINNTSGVREVVSSGVVATLLTGIQITSCAVLINGIMPRHFYEGVRVMALFVFYEVPRWEEDSENGENGEAGWKLFGSQVAKYYGGKDNFEYNPEKQKKAGDYVPEQGNGDGRASRMLQSRRRMEKSEIVLDSWRFERTGWTTFFVLDAGLQLVGLGVVWGLLVGFRFCLHRGDPTHRAVGRVYTIFHKVHEMGIMYFTISVVLGWVYFWEGSSQVAGLRWVSMVASCLLLLYYLGYHLYMYYDLFQYPCAHIRTASYLRYATKYGCFLSHTRYEESITELCTQEGYFKGVHPWSPRIWLRPYNYHILSFCKKVLMMLSLPLFHEYQFAQVIVLITLQSLEIARFLLTRPFSSRLRNAYRLILELALLLLFALILASQYIAENLMKDNPARIDTFVEWFNLLGWMALAVVVLYNVAIATGAVIELILLCRRGGNREKMDQIRRDYYWGRVATYEEENQDIDPNVVSSWVKLGNLNQDQDLHQKSNFLVITVERVRLESIDGQFFKMNVTKAVDVRARKEGFLQEEAQNRIFIQDRLHKYAEVTDKHSPELSQSFHALYNRYQLQAKFRNAKAEEVLPPFEKPRIRDSQEVVVESFLRVDLRRYCKGGKVDMVKDMFEFVISVNLNGRKVEKIMVEGEGLQGFPLDVRYLRNFH